MFKIQWSLWHLKYFCIFMIAKCIVITAVCRVCCWCNSLNLSKGLSLNQYFCNYWFQMILYLESQKYVTSNDVGKWTEWNVSLDNSKSLAKLAVFVNTSIWLKIIDFAILWLIIFAYAFSKYLCCSDNLLCKRNSLLFILFLHSGYYFTPSLASISANIFPLISIFLMFKIKLYWTFGFLFCM